jgi:hypothetical protein
MIPSRWELAELALRRQEDLSRQLRGAQWNTSASLLPDELRRAIVTVSVCHQTLRSLTAAEDGSQVSPTFSRERLRVTHHSEGSSEFSGRYGSVAVSIPVDGPSASERANRARLWRANLALAVDSASIAYRELLSASDWIVQRQALDSLLDYLANLESLEGAAGPAASFKSVAESARRIRILLEVRRQSVDASNVLYRDLESLTVEGTAWSYCAALLAETFQSGPNGLSDVRAAVKRVDDLRANLEKPAGAAPADRPFEAPSLRPSGNAKP